MVVFLGIATATENFGDVGKSELLPKGGMEIRFWMLPKERIGMDTALGKNDRGCTSVFENHLEDN